MWVLSRLLLLCIAVCADRDGTERKCQTTNCDCFNDYGDIEYQCPNKKAESKLVIHEEGPKKLIIECWDLNSFDPPLPNVTFSATQVTLSQCPVTLHSALVFNTDKVTILKLQNSIIERTFAWNFFNLPLPQLTKLSMKSITFEEDIHINSINAPNLSSLELEEVDIEMGSKLFANQSQLLELNLGFNNIRYLNNDIFKNLTNLEILCLSKNQIVSLNDDTFENLYNLKELQLDFNVIEDLHDKTFRNLKKLNILDLSNNNIIKIRREVFQPLTSIVYIYLDHNENLELDEYLFAYLPKLLSVSLDHSNLRYIPETLFIGSENLTHIMLDNNYITYVPPRLFKGLVNLHSLNLHNNKIKKLDGAMFRSSRKLKKLDLHFNEITSIDGNVFASLNVLKELNLGHNEISCINNDSFRHNILLEKIYLSHNKFVYKIDSGHFFHLSPFSSCPNLQVLDLSYNFVEDILEDLFLFTNHLRNLNLRGNRIKFVNVGSIWKIARKGIVLNLENNNITRFFFDPSSIHAMEILNNEDYYGDIEEEVSQIFISHNPLNCDCYSENFLNFLTNEMSPAKDIGIIFEHDELICKTPDKLQGVLFSAVSPIELTCPLDAVLHIPFCTSSRNCECYWRPHDRAIVINCSQRNLTEVPHLFLPADLNFNHTEIHLENNFLTKSPENELGYDNVTKLYLSNNRLETITWIPANIEVMDLSNNLLRRLNETTMEALNESSIRYIFLGKNPWSCECEIYNMTVFLRNNIKKVDIDHVRCYTGEKRVIDLNEEEICNNETLLFILSLAIFFLFLSIVAIVLALYYKYKNEVKIWMYTRGLCLSFFAEDDLDKNKKFDVFICYSHKDEDFVVNELLPVLEHGPIHYEVCIHNREWIPGELITDNIIYSITNSKRTLVILTPNLLESAWGKMEFKIAHNEAMRERRNRIILVIKEDVDFNLLDDEIKGYIRTNTYLKWKDAWFWKRLAYALPHKRIDDFQHICESK